VRLRHSSDPLTNSYEGFAGGEAVNGDPTLRARSVSLGSGLRGSKRGLRKPGKVQGQQDRRGDVPLLTTIEYHTLRTPIRNTF
jgi:hypothetical protein